MAVLKVVLQNQTILTLELDPAQEYLAGRADSCAIVLTDGQGISRNHFKLFFAEGQWKIDVVAKFGHVFFNGRPEKALELENNINFRVPPYDFQYLERNPDEPKPVVSQNLPATTEPPPQQVVDDGPFVEDPNEGTRVGDPVGVPFVKIMSSSGQVKQVLRLDGRSWTAGREAICAIHIEDPRVSRRQFEITQTTEGFFIIDLGSANGTMVNGELISSNDYSPLRSGDAISVLDNFLYFELRDPQFEKRLMEVSSKPLPSPFISSPAYSDADPEDAPQYEDGYDDYGQEPHYENNEPPQYQEPDAYSQNQIEYKGSSARGKSGGLPKMNPVRMLIVVIALGGGAAYLLGEKSGPSKPANEAAVATDPFSRLKSEQKNLVKHSYNLAKNLYIQGKYELAAQEIAKVHELVPEYEDSKEIAQQCQNAFEINRQRAIIERQEADMKEQEEKIQTIVMRCRQKLNSAPSEIEQCLQPALEINPEHEKIIALKSEAEQIAEAQKIKAVEKEAYQGSIQRGKTLFAKAEAINQSGDLLKAKKAYETFIASGLPDPSGLKAQAQRKIASIQSTMSAKLSEFTAQSQKQAGAKDYKGAILTLDKAIKFSPDNEEIHNQQDGYKKDLTKQMRDIYQEAILEESVGNVESAKEKWKNIIANSIPTEEYYRKATIKIKKYGGG